jgi:hypothetical protein
MLCYKIDSLDALDELKAAKACAFKDKANKKALKALISNPYDFF